MSRFWLDASMLIDAKNRAYGFDIAPGFWTALDRKTQDNSIASSSLVYDELVRRSDDQLARWARDRKDWPFWVTPDRKVQDTYRQVAEYVYKTYPPPQVNQSFRGADLWIIAHALVENGRVVTKEALAASSSKQAKIPNICRQFGLKPVDTWDMLRSLGVELHIRE